MVKSIIATSGHEILVDEEDFDRLAKYKWQTISNRNNSYASRHACINGKKTKILMHREIMGDPEGIIDHIDMNGLNCQKSNLRVVTHSQNGMNTRAFGKIKHRCISVHKDKYRVQMSVNGKRMGGVRATIDEAVKLYNDLVLRYRPEHGRLNLLS